VVVSKIQGGHSPGKPRKVREFQTGQGKVVENEKVREKSGETEISVIVPSSYH